MDFPLTVNIETARKLSGLPRDLLRELVRTKVLPNVGSSMARPRIPRLALERYVNGEQK